MDAILAQNPTYEINCQLELFCDLAPLLAAGLFALPYRLSIDGKALVVANSGTPPEWNGRQGRPSSAGGTVVESDEGTKISLAIPGLGIAGIAFAADSESGVKIPTDTEADPEADDRFPARGRPFP